MSLPNEASLPYDYLPRSKKAAKHEAAGAALRSFVQFKDTCEVQAAISYVALVE